MIRIILGNVGSGKTAFCVRLMALDWNHRRNYSNIITSLKNQIDLNKNMIIKKDLIRTVKKRNGIEEPVYKLSVNIEFWKSIKEPINVIIDEVHSIFNARKGLSKWNIILSDWISMLRRVLGATESGYGQLIMISQLQNRIDIIAREMATNITFVLCHYFKECKNCYCKWNEHSEMPELYHSCPQCGGLKIRKFSHKLEVWEFSKMESYLYWKEFGAKSFFKHYFVDDIEDYFEFYDTLQWENLLSDY